MRKQWISKAAALGALMWLFAIGAQAQEGSSIENIHAVGPTSAWAGGTPPATLPPIYITKDDLKPFRPKFAASFARAFQYQYQRAEQPRSVVVASGTTTQIIENPEHYLNQHSLIFDFSELFPASPDLASLVKRIYASRLTSDPTSAKRQVRLDELCGGKPVFMCLATGVNPWKRALSGLSVTASLSERSAVQQGILLPQPSFSEHYGLSGQIDFDPTRLFIAGSNWKNAISAAQNMRIDPDQPYCDCFQYLADNEVQDPATQHLLPGERYQACISKFAEPRIVAPNHRMRADAILKVFIPKFQFKRASQFDFVKNGGTLLPAPFPSPALNSYMITWDLRRVIATTSNRMDAFDAITEGYKRPQSGSNTAGTSGTPQQFAKLCIIASGTSKSYVNIPSTFDANSCHTLARNTSADHYGLACISSNDVSVGPLTSIAVIPNDTTKPDSNSCRW
jgi:hypothetical protein